MISHTKKAINKSRNLWFEGNGSDSDVRVDVDALLPALHELPIFRVFGCGERLTLGTHRMDLCLFVRGTVHGPPMPIRHIHSKILKTSSRLYMHIWMWLQKGLFLFSLFRYIIAYRYLKERYCSLCGQIQSLVCMPVRKPPGFDAGK